MDKATDKDIRKGLPSASGIARMDLCPGSQALEAGLPEETNHDAQEGTRLHDFIEHSDRDRSDLEPEQLESVEWCETQMYEMRNEFGFKDAEETAEDRLWFHDEAMRPLFSGQADRMFLKPKERQVFLPDFKFGRIRVSEPTVNLQLMTLAVLVDHNCNIDEAVVGILQPRLRYKRAARYTRKELDDARVKVFNIIDRAKTPNAPRIPSCDACHYCKAKRLCPEYNFLLFIVAELTPDQIKEPWHVSLALDRIEHLEYLAKALKGYAKDLISQGIDVPGWELGKGKTTSTITQPDVAISRLENMGVTTNEILQVMKLGMGGLRKLVSDKKQVKGKALAAEMNTLLEGIISKTISGPPLVRQKFVAHPTKSEA